MSGVTQRHVSVENKSILDYREQKHSQQRQGKSKFSDGMPVALCRKVLNSGTIPYFHIGRAVYFLQLHRPVENPWRTLSTIRTTIPSHDSNPQCLGMKPPTAGKPRIRVEASL